MEPIQNRAPPKIFPVLGSAHSKTAGIPGFRSQNQPGAINKTKCTQFEFSTRRRASVSREKPPRRFISRYAGENRVILLESADKRHGVMTRHRAAALVEKGLVPAPVWYLCLQNLTGKPGFRKNFNPGRVLCQIRDPRISGTRIPVRYRSLAPKMANPGRDEHPCAAQYG